MGLKASVIQRARRWLLGEGVPVKINRKPRLGIALGGGFARGVAHLGVLRVLERNNIPVGAIAGVSAGSIVAAAYASGTPVDSIEAIARGMRFNDVARWTISRLGLMASERMTAFLKKLLLFHTFEEMRIPLVVVATDLKSGKPVQFHTEGDALGPIRASCSYPGLFLPVIHEDKLLVDGAMSMDIPSQPLRALGCTHVLSVTLPPEQSCVNPRNVIHVINRCFQIMQDQNAELWRRYSDLVISPKVSAVGWDGFQHAEQLIAAGEEAATEALPVIRAWLHLDQKLGASEGRVRLNAQARPAPAEF